MNAPTPLEAAERAVARLEAASAAHPLEFLDDLAWALSHLANSRSHVGDHDGAVEARLGAHLLHANRPEEARFAALEAHEWQEGRGMTLVTDAHAPASDTPAATARGRLRCASLTTNAPTEWVPAHWRHKSKRDSRTRNDERF